MLHVAFCSGFHVELAGSYSFAVLFQLEMTLGWAVMTQRPAILTISSHHYRKWRNTWTAKIYLAGEADYWATYAVWASWKPFINIPQVYILRGRRNGRPIVQNVILAMSDKWLSLDTRQMEEQIIIAQMSFINLGQVLMPCYLSEGRVLKFHGNLFILFQLI